MQLEIAGAAAVTIARLSYDCCTSTLRHPENDQRSIDKPAAVAADLTRAEAAFPSSVHNGTHSALSRGVTMEIKEFCKSRGPRRYGCLLNDLDCYGDYVRAATLRPASPF